MVSYHDPLKDKVFVSSVITGTNTRNRSLTSVILTSTDCKTYNRVVIVLYQVCPVEVDVRDVKVPNNKTSSKGSLPEKGPLNYPTSVNIGFHLLLLKRFWVYPDKP